MSENIPESIPTSMDPQSHRPNKKRALSPSSAQAAQLAGLMKNPDRFVPTAKSREKKLAPPPEIVANVQGSSAGAGSGEFHVYKASRRREYERLKMMDDELKREQDKEEFDTKTEEWKKKDDAKTAKNRAKRQKKKLAQEKKKESERTGTPQFESTDNEVDDAGADGAAGPTDNEVGPQIKLVKNIQPSNGTSAAVAPSSGNRSIVIFDDD
ncbi:hypothetical protein TWF173_005022 [Orbilia oligospora]|uniref:DUF1168 domain protein n=2 Tax=Orbilia oligospora TaxID=2813651 RepID=G1XKC2_ARTOA|nr:hypothetical protein AOL_s00109g151 [Orbilia oligospora ATCC 24927]EGX46393.1 hypothetical protein AOL_s00109g151 [Orbilia oligospora ATCC 24927]KAF3272306.1 hypothetical protein TWF970_010127 [Orbilia oligospora]KAF3314157.1 hypothetical protein TWF173_005022 [Orbilia oligospora]